MTDIRTSRPVRRKVLTARGEELAVMLTPEGIWIREPRRKTAFLLPYGNAFQRAVDLKVAADAREKAERRKLKKLSK